eukprot:7466222-Heterocapsa_arctica.AAC.1
MADVTEEPEAEPEPDPPTMCKVMEFIENHPYPEFEVVRSFYPHGSGSWKAYDKSNHDIIRVLYENIHDVDMIHQGATIMAGRS